MDQSFFAFRNDLGERHTRGGRGGHKHGWGGAPILVRLLSFAFPLPLRPTVRLQGEAGCICQGSPAADRGGLRSKEEGEKVGKMCLFWKKRGGEIEAKGEHE